MLPWATREIVPPKPDTHRGRSGIRRPRRERSAYIIMPSLRTQLVVVLFWLAATGWLVVTELLPVIGHSSLPDTRVVNEGDTDEHNEIHWRIRLNGEEIGTAKTVTKSTPGGAEVDSLIQLHRLPIKEVMENLLGGLASMIQAGPAPLEDLTVGTAVRTRMQFDSNGRFTAFDSEISMDDVGQLAMIRGVAKAGQLRVTVDAGHGLPRDGTGGTPRLFDAALPLSTDALVADGLSPQPRLASLQVGQHWTFRAYRPFPPHRPIRLVRATVEHRELLMWEGDIETVFIVSFHDADTDGPTASSEAFSRLWVRDDGTVLKQAMSLGAMQVEFDRELRPRGSERLTEAGG